jgi:hypothetical protein
MARIEWDKTGERRYETGVDHAVLYIPTNGAYTNGVPWNGITSIAESPSGAEATPIYADNMKYLNLLSVEEFGGTIEAITFPDEFYQFDGGAMPTPGIIVSQQSRPKFGLSYRSLIGNDVQGDAAGYKLHLVYGAQASPSERTNTTINDSPEATPLSWEFSTTAVPVTGLKPTSLVTIDSTKVLKANLDALETILYGTAGVNPRLPSPSDVIALFTGTATSVTPVAPTYNATTHVISIPTTANVDYYIGSEVVTGSVTLTTGQTKVVEARPKSGYYFPANIDDDWAFSY